VWCVLRSVLNCLLLEHSVLVLSSKLEHLTPILEALLALLYPIKCELAPACYRSARLGSARLGCAVLRCAVLCVLHV
jgi:hypothetical protein